MSKIHIDKNTDIEPNNDIHPLTDTPLLDNINDHCLAGNYENRKDNMYIFSNITNNTINKDGCFLCNDNKNNLELNNRSWDCNEYITIDRLNGSNFKQLLLQNILSTSSITYFLPTNIQQIIINNCFDLNKMEKINKITLDLLQHSDSCKKCADNIIKLNTYHSCPNHTIPRTPIAEMYLAYHV
jgi:hypothetical protein